MARNREFSDWFEIDDGGHQRDVFVTFTISPVVPATYWQPAEGGEIELLSADPEGCCDIIDSLSEATLDGIRAQIERDLDRYVADYDGPDPDDERDRRIDDRLTFARQTTDREDGK